MDWADVLGDDLVTVHVLEGESLFTAGEEASVGLLKAGVMRVFVRTPSGRELTIRYPQPGEIVGLTRAVSGTALWNTDAVTDATVAIVPFERLRELGSRDPDVIWQVAHDVAMWAAEVVQAISETAHQPMRAQVAHHLRGIARRGPDGRLVAHVSQGRLARNIGTVREVVSRELRGLRAEGVLATTAARIVILDERELINLAEGK